MRQNCPIRCGAILIGVYALVGGFGSACDPETSARNVKLSEDHYLLADDFLRKKQADAAKAELMRSLELDPRNAKAHQLLGVVFFLEGVHALDFMEIENCLEGKAAQEQTELANDRFRRADEHFRKVLSLLGKDEEVDPDLLNYLANIALHLKRYDEAIAFTNRALENIVYGFQHYLLGTRGWAYFQKGDQENAARDLRQALFYQPQFCIGRYRLAKVYYEQQDFAAAAEQLKNLATDASCPLQDAHQLLGLILTRQRQPAEARAEFDRCVTLQPKSCSAQACARYAKLL